MSIKNINVAIVEDNGVARINLRNHLLSMGFGDIGCFSQGRELRNAMRKRHFDLILMDFHLGQNNNGVEVIQELQQSGKLPPSTAIIFITADNVPMILGQIVDIHPDMVLLKPYTIKSLEKVVINTLLLRDSLKTVYRYMDRKMNAKALETLDELIRSKKLSKHHALLSKLRGRLLIANGLFDQAIAMYQKILQGSDKVVWARWGLVLSRYLSGDINTTEADLEDMLKNHLTKDKACEWLTRINIKKTEYERAQSFIDMIRESELSISAARLKVYLCQVQGNMQDAITLLEKKRESNRNNREKFAELTMDLARCHLAVAEKSEGRTRDNAIKSARLLIGSATRRAVDEDLNLKRNYMNALVAVMEGDEDKAMDILRQDGMMDFSNADVSLLLDAASAWMGVGESHIASEIMQECEQRTADLHDENHKTISDMQIIESEKNLGDKKTRALDYNKTGLKLFSEEQIIDAIEYFYQAHILFPMEPAFLINLLQCMVEARIPQHKKVNSLHIYAKLKPMTLSDSNQKRFDEIQQTLKQDIALHKAASEELTAQHS